jgi:Tfp pilus assembly protein PilN
VPIDLGSTWCSTTTIAFYEKLKQLRQSRIDVIEKLKENQTGPVLLLNSVIQSIPRDGVLWLTAMTQKSDKIKIVGFTQQTEVIPDFMSNLTASGIFKSVDLEMIDSQKEASKFSREKKEAIRHSFRGNP